MSENNTDFVIYETHDSLAIITLNRPEQHNCVDTAMTWQLRETMARFENDPSLRVAILTGAGKTFCAGMDLAAFLNGKGNEILFGKNRFAGFVDAHRTKPVIAAVEGAALAGGMEIALACDMIVASETAFFGLPEVGVGIFPVAGGAFRLAGKIPPAKALELCLTADRIDAPQAYQLGLINQITAPGKALDVARDLAKRILRNAPLAVSAAFEIGRDAVTAYETELWRKSELLWQDVIESGDAREGPKAFKEKRKPVWSG